MLSNLPNKICHPIIFSLGAIFGGIVTRHFVRKKALAMLDKEIAKTREYYGMKLAPGEEIVEEKDIPKEGIHRYTGPVTDVEMIDYTQFYKKKKVDPAEEEYPADGDEDESEHNNYIDGKRMTEESDYPGIEIIDQFSYDHDYPQFEKIELTYWSEDGILTDEEEHIIGSLNGSIERITDSLEKVVGTALFDTGLVDNPSVKHIYIRNFDLGCDYFITKMEASFEENKVR